MVLCGIIKQVSIKKLNLKRITRRDRWHCTIKEAAKKANVSKPTIYHWIDERGLKAFRYKKGMTLINLKSLKKVMKMMEEKNQGGRPESFTPKKIEMLRHAFAIGCTDEEACAYADVPTSTLYFYQKRHPEFKEEKERLKKKPILKAKNTVVKELDDLSNAQWYLERKSDFAKKSHTDITSKGESINLVWGEHDQEEQKNNT